MSDFSLILVLQIKTSVNRNKTWQMVRDAAVSSDTSTAKLFVL